MSSNHLSTVTWSRFAVTHASRDRLAQNAPFDGAAQALWPAAAAPSAAWASTLIRACASGRIGAAVMWDLLLAHADSPVPPDVAVLLEHLPEATASEPAMDAEPRILVAAPAVHDSADGVPSNEVDDWFVMVENLGAA